MKYILVLLSIVTTVAVSSIAHAALLDTDHIYVTAEVDPVAVVSTCGGVTFSSSFSANNSGQVSPSCNVDAYSNDPDGFYIELHGTNLLNGGTAWDKLSVNTGGMDTSCTSSCTEAWGFRIVNGTASEYDVVERDTDNPTGCTGTDCVLFDSNATDCGDGKDEPCWHTVNASGSSEQIITNSQEIANTAEFDLQFGAVIDNFLTVGNYQSTITITITAN